MAAPSVAAEARLTIPRHAMGMIIGTKGANFRDIQDIPELESCNLHQPNQSAGGMLIVKGSVRACVVASDRVGRIIDASFERNVRNGAPAPGPGPVRSRYERPRARLEAKHAYRRTPSPPHRNEFAFDDANEPVKRSRLSSTRRIRSEPELAEPEPLNETSKDELGPEPEPEPEPEPDDERRAWRNEN